MSEDRAPVTKLVHLSDEAVIIAAQINKAIEDSRVLLKRLKESREYLTQVRAS